VHLLQGVPVEAGIYRFNKAKDPGSVEVPCGNQNEAELPKTYVDYVEKPREYFLNTVTTVLDVHTRISDIYSNPFDQIKEHGVKATWLRAHSLLRWSNTLALYEI
jgi:hypothetical protein